MGTVYEPAGGADKPTESEKLLVIIDAAGQPSMRKDKKALGVGSLGKVADSEEATLASRGAADNPSRDVSGAPGSCRAAQIEAFEEAVFASQGADKPAVQAISEVPDPGGPDQAEESEQIKGAVTVDRLLGEGMEETGEAGEAASSSQSASLRKGFFEGAQVLLERMEVTEVDTVTDSNELVFVPAAQHPASELARPSHPPFLLPPSPPPIFLAETWEICYLVV